MWQTIHNGCVSGSILPLVPRPQIRSKNIFPGGFLPTASGSSVPVAMTSGTEAVQSKRLKTQGKSQYVPLYRCTTICPIRARAHIDNHMVHRYSGTYLYYLHSFNYLRCTALRTASQRTGTLGEMNKKRGIYV